MDKYENRAMELESGIAAFETKSFAHAIKLLSPIADEGNVEAAIAATHPYAVDVSGGVERVGGVKDVEKMTNFVRAVQSADRSNNE